MAHQTVAMSVPTKELVDNGESSANAEKDIMMDGMAGSIGISNGGSSTNSERDVMTVGSAGSSGVGDVDCSACNLWQFWSEKLQMWCDMNNEYCMLHDKIVSQEYIAFEYDYPRKNGKFYHYKVDLVAMTQTNSNTGAVRRIRRLVVSSPY